MGDGWHGAEATRRPLGRGRVGLVTEGNGPQSCADIHRRTQGRTPATSYRTILLSEQSLYMRRQGNGKPGAEGVDEVECALIATLVLLRISAMRLVFLALTMTFPRSSSSCPSPWAVILTFSAY
jgi:hypothetical protein